MSQESISSPPPAGRPATPPAPDARERLHLLAATLTGRCDARLLRDYLRLRAAVMR
ncbi:MAG TPA: hypothetical protein VF624_17880 [Tepidisphaeraceae bacterium]|jgi:hypothetical protein